MDRLSRVFSNTTKQAVGAVSGRLRPLRPPDPAALGTAAAVLLGSTPLAVYPPARRAAGFDPMAALRCE
jgi:hypothetical protein